MYIDVRPNIQNNAIFITKRLYELLGPAVIDRSGWGLLRPGLLNRDLLLNTQRIWRAKVSKIHEIYRYPQVRGNWIFFDYLFSKPTTINPLIKCLTSLGIARYGEIKVPNTYFVTVCLNYIQGILIFLYKGLRVEAELDNLAFIIAHALNAANSIKKVEFTRDLLINTAYNLVKSGRWKWAGWVTKESKSIPEKVLEIEWKKYQNALKKGDWKIVQLRNKFAKISFIQGKKSKQININIKQKYYKPGPSRDLRPVLDDLIKAIKPNKSIKIRYNEPDRAGILRAYTERRGILAAKKILEAKYHTKPIDVSYQFKGYDLQAEEVKAEVKSFKDSLVKSIKMTRDEFETMMREKQYILLVVENAWDNNPKVNVIYDPKNMNFNKRQESTIRIAIDLEEYYECEENRWRSKAVSYTHLTLPTN